MVHKNNLWDLFIMTDDLEYYLEFKNHEDKNLITKKQDNYEFSDTENDPLR